MFEITINKSYILVKFTTAVSYDSIILAVQSVMKHAHYKDLNDIFVVEDLPFFLGFEQLDEIIQHVEQAYPEGATRSKTALVISSGFGQVLARMLIHQAHRLPTRIELFSNLDDAEKWILSG